MTKSTLLYLLATVLLITAPIQAQQGRVYRVGVLGPPGRLEEWTDLKGLRDGLKEAGYAEGKNLLLKIPAVKTYDELRPIAKAYVGEKVDAIVTGGGTATRIAKEATREIAIIFLWGVGDPVQLGFVKSVARPETNITGVSSDAGIEIWGKRLELFKELVPTLRRVVLLYNARGENPSHDKSLGLLREIAPKLGLKLAEMPINSPGEVDHALSPLATDNTNGIFVRCSGLFREPFKRIATIAREKRFPLWGCFASEGEQGNLATYEPDRYHRGLRGAWYVDRILKGRRPQDLPVEAPMKYEFVIDLKAARQIGLTIPPNVLVRADRVIR